MSLREKCPYFAGSYFPVFLLNTGKYRAGKTPYLDTFHAVYVTFYDHGGKKVYEWEKCFSIFSLCSY